MTAPSPAHRLRTATSAWSRRRGVQILFAFLVLLAVLTVAATLALPPWLRGAIERQGSARLGRTVTVAAVELAPRSLALRLRGLQVAGVGTDPAPQLTVEQLDLDLAIASVLRGGPVVEAVTVQNPHLRLVHQGQGRYDVGDVVARLLQPADPAARPLPFVLNRLQVQGGQIDFTDVPTGRVHAVRGLALTVPFLSNRDDARAVPVAPRLAFTLDGQAFDTAALATPFAADRRADGTLQVRGMDLAPYLPYWPAGMPFRPTTGRLDADVKLAFRRAPEAQLALSGTLSLRGLRLLDSARQPLLGAERIDIDIAELRPLARALHLRQITVTAPTLQLRRDEGGRLNVQPTSAAETPEKIAARAVLAGTRSKNDIKTAGWNVRLDTLAVRNGRVSATDAAVQPAGLLQAEAIAIDASALAWPVGGAPARIAASAQLQGGGAIAVRGNGNPQGGQLQLTLDALPLDAAAPYLARWLAPRLAGRASGNATLDWRADTGWRADVASLAVEAPRLQQGADRLLAAERFELADAQIDGAARTVRIGKLAATGLQTALERGSDRRWNFERWRAVAPSTAVASAPASVPGAAAAPAAPWRVGIAGIALDNARLRFADRALPRPVAVDFSGVALRLADWRSGESARPLAGSIAGRVGAGQADAGQLDFQGQLVPTPFALRGTLAMVDVPLHAFEPYFGDRLNVELQRADANFKGTVEFASAASRASGDAGGGGATFRLAGDAALDDVRANRTGVDGVGQGTSESLLRWKSLGLRGLDVALVPAQPTAVKVRDAVLSDFFARLAVDEKGRINLQDLARQRGPGRAAVDAPESIAAHAVVVGVTGQNDVNIAPAAGGTASAAIPVVPADPRPALIEIGATTLVNGRVAFADRFIQPSYSANISALNGTLGAFSSAATGDARMASVDLRGVVEGSAPLEISGRVNPVSRPLALDIKAQVRDLDLPPLSAYSVKYAGYGIERGKLSVVVEYKLQPDGVLTASNRITLNQLRFGDKAEGATASLPVKLAAALLADRNGVIDLDLPISGSINDPQFRLAPLVWRALGGLIARAVTSPLALLTGGAAGGQDSASEIGFAAGSAEVAGEGAALLDRTATALIERPALRITVAGTASLAAEAEGWKQQRLRQRTLAQKRRDLLAELPEGATPPTVAPVTDDEYPELLRAVYRRADMRKPRNIVGLPKTLSVPEMESLLRGDLVVNEDAMRELAARRSTAARDYLVGRGVPAERIFLGVPRTVAEPTAGWQPHAGVQVSAR